MKISLKTQNAPIVWSILSADGVLLAWLLLDAPIGTDWPTIAGKFLGTLGAPALVALLSSLLPSNVKAVLVFWRVRDVLPGHRAFSVIAHNDPRINVTALERHLGYLPELPKEQNALWYKLYKKVEADTAVASVHRNFLLFRDVAAISLLVAAIFSPAMFLFGITPKVIGCALLLFITQYFLAMIAARNHANAFVSNVLALHSIKRYR